MLIVRLISNEGMCRIEPLKYNINMTYVINLFK